MRVLAIDLETTGLDPRADLIIEVGAAVWDTDRKAVLATRSAFIEGVAVQPEITAITGITQADIDEWGRPLDGVLDMLDSLGHEVDYYAGHNARAFDRLFLGDRVVDRPWLDTMTDLPLPDGMKARALTHLAAEHGFLNPFPHRALFDALTSLRLLACYPIEEVVRHALAPAVTLVAHGLPFERKDEAKSAGFQWDATRKVWTKTVKDFQVPALKAALTFTTREQT